ncbi:MAG: HAD hydrolase-like protein [Candidatus Anstonellales archaeon]
MIVFWDLDGTIRKNAELSYEAARVTLNKYFPDLRLKSNDAEEIYTYWNLATFLAIRNNRNVFQEFLRMITDKSDYDMNLLRLAADYAKSYVHQRIENLPPYEFTEHALQLTSDFRNGIISHAKAGSTKIWLRNYGLDRYFDSNLIFDGVHEKADYMRGNFIYIGDSIADLYSFLLSLSRGNNGLLYMIRGYRYGKYRDELIEEFDRTGNISSRIVDVENALEAAKMISNYESLRL